MRPSTKGLHSGNPLAPVSAPALLLVLGGTARAEGETYDVRLTRPDAVGDKSKISAEGALIRKTVVIIGDQRSEQDPIGAGVKLEGTAEALAVTAKGKPTKVAVAVDRCVKVSGPDEAELLPKGSVLVAQVDGKDTKFSLKEGELPESASEVLDLLLQLNSDDSRGTDDQLLGTKGKRAVGDIWQVNGAQAAKDFAAEGITVDASDVGGDVKLESVQKVDGTDRLKIAGMMKVKKILPGPDAAAALPEGIKAEAGSMQFKFELAVPVDVNDRSGEESISIRHQMTYSGKLPTGQDVRTEVTMERAARMKRTAIK